MVKSELEKHKKLLYVLGCGDCMNHNSGDFRSEKIVFYRKVRKYFTQGTQNFAQSLPLLTVKYGDAPVVNQWQP